VAANGTGPFLGPFLNATKFGINRLLRLDLR
jgi:hypothetical protein